MASIHKNGQVVGFVRFRKDLQGLLCGVVRDTAGKIQLFVFQEEDVQTKQHSWTVRTPAPEQRTLGRGSTRRNAVFAAGYELR